MKDLSQREEGRQDLLNFSLLGLLLGDILFDGIIKDGFNAKGAQPVGSMPNRLLYNVSIIKFDLK